jgi:hypothetical protein
MQAQLWLCAHSPASSTLSMNFSLRFLHDARFSAFHPHFLPTLLRYLLALTMAMRLTLLPALPFFYLSPRQPSFLCDMFSLRASLCTEVPHL